MTLRNVGSAAGVVIGLASGASAMTVGQPFLIAEDNLSGSTLDFFDGFGPTGVNVIDVTGTITSTFGAPGLIGETLAFRSNLAAFTDEAELTVGGTVLSGLEVLEGGSPAYDFDPFRPGPGDLNIELFVEPPFIDSVNGSDPTKFDFTYTGAYSDFPPSIGVDFPGIELLLSIYLDGPLPMQTFDVIDSNTNMVTSSFDYIEGPLSISRITLGLIGGEPLPKIPLPAGMPLLLLGLCALGLARRRRATA
ncbi:MAG: VPLPA-CTERM sorting domain-containing protein [Pseudomonadota bacterium]